MRIVYKDKLLPLELASFFIHADVVQHKAWAAVSDDEQDMVIANRLIRLGFFSPVYTQAGLEMMQKKADDGYQPAQIQLAALSAPYLPPPANQ